MVINGGAIKNAGTLAETMDGGSIKITGMLGEIGAIEIAGTLVAVDTNVGATEVPGAFGETMGVGAIGTAGTLAAVGINVGATEITGAVRGDHGRWDHRDRWHARSSGHAWRSHRDHRRVRGDHGRWGGTLAVAAETGNAEITAMDAARTGVRVTKNDRRG